MLDNYDKNHHGTSTKARSVTVAVFARSKTRIPQECLRFVYAKKSRNLNRSRKFLAGMTKQECLIFRFVYKKKRVRFLN